MEVTKTHEILMEEEGYKMSDLPKAIQNSIKGWNVNFKRYERNPDENEARSLQKNSVRIADKIQDFHERDFDDNSDDDNEGSDDDKKSKKGGSGSGKNKDSDNDDNDSGGKSSKKTSQTDDKGSDDDGSGKSKSDKKDQEGGDSDDKGGSNPKSKRFGNVLMKQKIMDKIKEDPDERISIKDLTKIIGKEPDYPYQEVYDIKLKKVFMSSEYWIA